LTIRCFHSGIFSGDYIMGTILVSSKSDVKALSKGEDMFLYAISAHLFLHDKKLLPAMLCNPRVSVRNTQVLKKYCKIDDVIKIHTLHRNRGYRANLEKKGLAIKNSNCL
jgi:hypothetical protein